MALARAAVRGRLQLPSPLITHLLGGGTAAACGTARPTRWRGGTVTHDAARAVAKADVSARCTRVRLRSAALPGNSRFAIRIAAATGSGSSEYVCAAKCAPNRKSQADRGGVQKRHPTTPLASSAPQHEKGQRLPLAAQEEAPKVKRGEGGSLRSRASIRRSVPPRSSPRRCAQRARATPAPPSGALLARKDEGSFEPAIGGWLSSCRRLQRPQAPPPTQRAQTPQSQVRAREPGQAAVGRSAEGALQARQLGKPLLSCVSSRALKKMSIEKDAHTVERSNSSN